MSYRATARDGRDHAFSASPWVDGALHRALVRAEPAILEAARPFRPRGLLLSGSAALGEAVGWEAGDPAERLVLSDLDLGLVTADPIPEQDRRRIVAAARAAGTPTDPVSTPVEVTLGCYLSAQWTRQTATLGMSDARTRGIVLWGDASLFERLPEMAAARVARWEGVRLVGNRALELLAAPGPRSAPSLSPRGWHALAKAVTGLWTARLVIEGRYRTGWAERRALLDQQVRLGGVGNADAVVRGASAWAPFLDRPGPELLPARAAWLPAYQEALAAWFAWLPPDVRAAGQQVERLFLGEPLTLRARWRAWRAEQRRVPGGAGMAERIRAHALPARFRWRSGTPEGRRMAAAILYWHDLPERPEPLWGEASFAYSAGPAWEARIHGLVGRSVPPGPGCRSRLMAVLGMEAAPATGAQEGEPR